VADIRLESDGGVRHLVLDAPGRRNALTAGMLTEMAAAVRAVREDPEARVLVVRGEGKAFCAGADLQSLFGDLTRPTDRIRDDLKQIYGSFLGLTELTVPTIAAVDGVAVGAGVNIALACDVVIASPRARFAVTFADIRLHPGGGCSWFLTRRLGPGRALATVLDGGTIDAQEAYRAGLVARLTDDPVATAAETAGRWARRDPALVRDMKRAVQIAGTADLATTVDFESWAQAAAVGRPAFAEFVEAFTSR
jgi:enoyl-CoA hydratase